MRAAAAGDKKSGVGWIISVRCGKVQDKRKRQQILRIFFAGGRRVAAPERANGPALRAQKAILTV
ncbi:hypothetical protein ACRQV7_12640 [Caproiciproducens sp. R2]|uniref:hypothetical protein n=1 Tax=Caproiciproducens sp. R2 TaxID=3435187 RepID=UPI004033C362